MNLERRFKRFRIDPDSLLAMLKGSGFNLLKHPLPPDARWITWGWDPNLQMVIAVIWSIEFDRVEPDREIPFTLNGPIIEVPTT
jgi:hypothetical protein